MKLESLNIWGGQVTKPLLSHIEAQSDNIDIFCFQEVFNGRKNARTFPKGVVNIYSRIAERLPNHRGFFRRQENMGLASFVRKSIQLQEEGDIFVYRWLGAMVGDKPETQGRNLQYLKFNYLDKQYTVANLHGLWNGKGKTDTPDRIEQSTKVKVFLDSKEGAKILCGDFNLLPDTQSLAILEVGMRNLVKEYYVTSTRSKFYEKPDRFADYILLSPEVQVNGFKVLQDPVSDHLALQLDFE